MRLLRPGQEIVLSWREGAIDCRVVAAAGRYVLVHPQHDDEPGAADVRGSSSLTYLDGMIPMGWDGTVEPGLVPGELRFCVSDPERPADRRSSVRIPIMAPVAATAEDGSRIDGHLLDVSAGGLRFRHPGRLERDRTLRVRAELPDDLTIDADAVIRMSEPGVTAVEFTAYHAATPQEIGRWTVEILRAHLRRG